MDTTPLSHSLKRQTTPDIDHRDARRLSELRQEPEQAWRVHAACPNARAEGGPLERLNAATPERQLPVSKERELAGGKRIDMDTGMDGTHSHTPAGTIHESPIAAVASDCALPKAQAALRRENLADSRLAL
eukprot:6833382-Prymnesium_polylepis.1